MFDALVELCDTQRAGLAAVCFLLGCLSALRSGSGSSRNSSSSSSSGGSSGSGSSSSSSKRDKSCIAGPASLGDKASPKAYLPQQRPPPPGALSVRHMLDTHREDIESLRALVCTHPHFKPERHDGLWLLRYLLSHKLRVRAAAAAARKSLQIRHERQLDAIADFVRTKLPNEWPHFKAVRPLAVIEMLPARVPTEDEPERAAWDVLKQSLLDEAMGSDEALAAAQATYTSHGGVGVWQWYDRGVVEVGRLADIRMHALWPMRQQLDDLTMYSSKTHASIEHSARTTALRWGGRGFMHHADMPLTCCGAALAAAGEWLFQVLDEATRRTGVLVKVTRMLSLRGFALSMLNLKLARWDAQAKAETQDLYPQLQGEMLLVDPPKALLWAWTAIVRPLLPKRVAERTHLVDTTTAAGRATLQQRCSLESLPTFLGGSSTMPWPPQPKEWLPPLGALTFGKGGTFRRYD